MIVEDILKSKISSKVISINHNQTFKEALDCLEENKVYTLPVVTESNELCGMISKSHLLKAAKNKFNIRVPVKNIMASNLITVKKETPIETIGDLIRYKQIGRFPVVDEHNRLINVITKTDVLIFVATEAEKLLHETGVILNTADTGVLAVDNQGFIRIFNQAAKNIFKSINSDFTGQHASLLTTELPILKVLAQGEPITSHKVKIRGTQVVTHINPIIIKGKVHGAVSVFQNISKLEAIAEELEEVKSLKETLLTLVENPHEAAIVVDAEGTIKLINQAYCDFLGVTKAEVIGRKVYHVVPETKLMEVLKTREPQLSEIWEIRGHEVVVMRVPIFNDGKLIGAIGKSIFADLSIAKEFAAKINRVRSELDYYKQELSKERLSKYTFDQIVGKSDEVNNLIKRAKKAAKTSSTVIITGESGTGKELLAHAIHHESQRSNYPFVKINCAGIPESLLESELFGYESGAFTGAKKGGKLGKFQVANRGTIFLDEIGDTPLTMQAKLLRVLQEKEIEPIGSNTQIKVDVRVIAATNKNLEELIKVGEFREDLYYRLNVINLNTPALRERKEDIPLICNHLINKLNRDLYKNVEGITDDALEMLFNYSWPGNIRELQNILERAMNLTDEEYLDVDHFSSLVTTNYYIKQQGETVLADKEPKPLTEAIEAAEKEALINALKYTNYNKNKAAQLLKIHRSMLYRKLNKYQLLD